MMLLTKFSRIGSMAGASVLALAVFASAAHAEIITTLYPAADEDQTIVIEMDGNVATTGIEGLTATVELTFLQAYEVTDFNLWVFNATVSNTVDPTLFEDARISAFGFNTGGFCDVWADDFCIDDSDDTLIGVGSLNGANDTRVVTSTTDSIFDLTPELDAHVNDPQFFLDESPVYEFDNEGAFPNQFGSLDVCFIMNTNNCSGGGVGGVSMTDGSQTFTFVLAFAGSLVDNPQIELSNFGVRYQSIWSEFYGFQDESGTGGHRVPEPGTLVIMMLGLAGIGWSRRRRAIANA